MDTKQNNSQPFYPKYLNRNEAGSPISVIGDFFSADWLPGHLSKLQEWRRYVIEEEYYNGKGKSPASLLMTHQLSARLVEAMYLLSKSKKGKALSKVIHINFEEQLLKEEKEWLHYPVYLSPVERINPYLAISKFFEVYNIDQYLEFLYEWLEAGLSVSTIDDDLDISDVICFYENLQKLYEAAWIIHQREIRPVLKGEVAGKVEVSFPVKRGTSNVSLIRHNCRFNDQLRPDERFGLSKLVELILSKVASVLMIVHLGTYPSPATFYLLVVIDDNNHTDEQEMVNGIENVCRQYINVYAIVHKAAAFIRGLEEGNRFFINSLVKPNIAYQWSDLALPKFISKDQHAITAEIETAWKRWGGQGREFLDAAWHCIQEKTNSNTLFLLHQAMESTLSAIIRVVLGYRLTAHNLSRMLRFTLLFTDDLISTFDYSSESEVKLFALLQSAYSASRYKEDFDADAESIDILADKVADLFATAEELYRKAIDSLKA